MTPDDLDRILASEEDTLMPSSGFVMNVMEAVRAEAAEPVLRFPWLRFGTGLAACGVMAAAGSVLLPRVDVSLAPIAVPLLRMAPELSYAIAAVLVSVAVAIAPRLLARD